MCIRDSAMIIRSGIAKKIEELHTLSVDEQTTFQAVRYDFGRLPEGTEPIQVCAWIRNGLIETIGSRPNKGSDEAGMLPEEPFSKEDIALVAGMIDELDLAKTTGELPHLDHSLGRLLVACPSYIAYEKTNSRALS